jgi:predicted polyphosphate/ATP-dependent NAD kinase
LPAVGVIANPASGRDVRRLVAGASVFDNAEKGSMVYRLMVGLGAAGVEKVLMMPAGSGLGESLARMLRGQAATAGVTLPALETLDMPVRDTAEDTLRATLAVREHVAAIAVLGGDGTCRLVARHCGDLPLLALSTGTNNAFPELREATAAGLALGLVATRQVGSAALRRAKILRVSGDFALSTAPPVADAQRGEDCALVDVALTREPWVGARALWRPETIAEAVVAVGEPGAVGLSALAALLDPVPRTAPYGLHVVLAPAAEAETVLSVPLAPGRIVPVGVAQARRIEPDAPLTLRTPAGSLALDGEREHELAEDRLVEVTLGVDGPVVVDVPAALAEAAGRGLLAAAGG